MPTAAPSPTVSAMPAQMLSLLAASGLQPMTLAGRRLLPIVQGGMGVGVSAHGWPARWRRSAASARSARSTCGATTPT